MTPDDAPSPDRPIDVTRRGILLTLLAGFPPGRALELGCGTGWFSLAVADAGWDVDACDVRPRDWPRHPRVHYFTRDIRDLNGLGGYDLILCLGVFYHLTLDEQLALLGWCEAQGAPIILDTHVGTPSVRYGDYEGHLYPEPEGMLSAAPGSPNSFWPTHASLTAMFANHGYTLTAWEPWYHGTDRTFFTATRSAHDPDQ